MKKRSGKTVRAAGSRVRSRRTGRQSTVPHNAVFLVGFMGAGKTSVGRALGQRLNWLFEDLDDRIQRREKRSIAEIFRDSGEAAFRRAEHDALRQLIDELPDGEARIVALGGGAFVQENNVMLLENSGQPTIFLDAPIDELWQRCCDQAVALGAERPLVVSQPQFRQLHEMRRHSYTRASITIKTGNRTVNSIATSIARKLGLKKYAGNKEKSSEV